MPSQFLFVGDQIMDRCVAEFADLDSRSHLLPRVPLLEPLVAVKGSRDEVMKVVGILRLA